MNNFLLENIILPVGDLFNSSSYVSQLKYWRKVDKYSENKLKELQENNLKKLLSHTTKTVSFYNHIKKSDNVHEWLQNFPILTKDLLRNNQNELISSKFDKSKLIEYSSSGSSGVQSSVFMTKYEQSIIRGILTHWWEWSGYRIGDSIVQTGMSHTRSKLKKLKDLLFRTIYINAFSLSEKELHNLFKQINNSHFFLAGYASSLNIIAEFALKYNYKANIKAVISLGDKLFDSYKANIRNAFNCPIYDSYGSNEGLMIGMQKDLDFYYILSPHVYVEVLDDSGNKVKDGEIGNLVVTRLDAFSMPLIRFKLGDLGSILPKEDYPKNRTFNYPLLKHIIGRETDIIKLSDGRKLTVHSFTGILEYVEGIKQFQIYQDKLDEIELRYIIDYRHFNEELLISLEKELLKKINCPKFKINFIEVNEIKPSKSGKPQIVISKML